MYVILYFILSALMIKFLMIIFVSLEHCHFFLITILDVTANGIKWSGSGLHESVIDNLLQHEKKRY